MDEKGIIVCAREIDEGLELQLWSRGKTPRLVIVKPGEKHEEDEPLSWLEGQERKLSLKGAGGKPVHYPWRYWRSRYGGCSTGSPRTLCSRGCCGIPSSFCLTCSTLPGRCSTKARWPSFPKGSGGACGWLILPMAAGRASSAPSFPCRRRKWRSSEGSPPSRFQEESQWPT